MEAVNAAFGDEILVYPVNDEWITLDSSTAAATVSDFLNDTGMPPPVLIDQTFDSSCCVIPQDDASVAAHFRLRVGDPSTDPPFPLHMVIRPDGTFAYLRRAHVPDDLLNVLQDLIDASE